MKQLFGSSPKVVQEPNVNSTSPAQQQLQQLLVGQLSGLLPGVQSNVQGGQPGVPYPTQFGAPLTSVQQNLIGQLTGSPANLTGQANSVLNPAQGALTSILSGQPLDYSNYFLNDVAQPLEQTFSQQTLPALKAAFARSAGGTNTVGQNTGYSAAVGQAAQQLENNLSQESTALATNAATQARNLQASGIQMAPNLASSFLQNYYTPLNAALTAAGLPQQAEQTQLTGQANWATNALNLLSQLYGTGSGIASSPTIQQGNTAVYPGSQGYLGTILGGLAMGAGGAMMASDPRLKKIKKGKQPSALEVLKALKVKQAHYKWEDTKDDRPMLMADNVEKIHPAAAARVNDVGFVKPMELIPLLVKGVQELSKAA